jgi:hypothetical protein
MMLAKGALHRVQNIAFGQSFDRCDICAFTGKRQHGARFDAYTIDMDRAATTLGGVAAHMCACEFEMFAQELNEQCAGFDLTANAAAIHLH